MRDTGGAGGAQARATRTASRRKRGAITRGTILCAQQRLSGTHFMQQCLAATLVNVRLEWVGSKVVS